MLSGDYKELLTYSSAMNQSTIAHSAAATSGTRMVFSVFELFELFELFEFFDFFSPIFLNTMTTGTS